MNMSLSIGILFEQRHITYSQPANLIEALQVCGHRVTLLNPRSLHHKAGNRFWLNKFDLFITRGKNPGLQYLLALAEMQESPMISHCAGSDTASSKINMLSCQAHDSCYTVIIKSTLGDKGNGLHIVQNPDEIARQRRIEATALIQQYLPGDGCDLKLYGTGDGIWVVSQPASISPLAISI